MTHRAACQCGQLLLESAADPDVVILCNCRACQRRSGSPFGVGAYFPRDAVTVSGAHRNWSRTAESGRGLTNHFCPECGTTVFWSLEMRPGQFGVPAGCLSTPAPEPMRAIWTEEKHGWVTFPAHWPSFRKAAPSA